MPALSAHPLGTPLGLSPNAGPLASAAWLVARDLQSQARWWVEVTFATRTADGEPARLQLEIYTEEWGFLFEHGSRSSWIRVTDIPFAHGRDDLHLLPETPPLREIARLVAALEARFELDFPREHAVIRTSLRDSVPAIRAWAATL